MAFPSPCGVGLFHAWAIIHTAWLHCRFAVSKGETAYERSGREYHGKICLHGILKPSAKGLASWLRGLWLGKTQNSDGHILASFKTYEFICGASTAAGCAARARVHFRTCAQARARAREQKDVRARGARATSARTWRASKNELAREQGARTQRSRARARVL